MIQCVSFMMFLLLLALIPGYAAGSINSLIPNGDIESGIWAGGGMPAHAPLIPGPPMPVIALAMP